MFRRPLWNTIDTAPKDGTLILAWAKRPFVAAWAGYWRDESYDVASPGDEFVTHWMPIPKGPQA